MGLLGVPLLKWISSPVPRPGVDDGDGFGWWVVSSYKRDYAKPAVAFRKKQWPSGGIRPRVGRRWVAYRNTITLVLSLRPRCVDE